jgi:hypothetical protein
LLLDEMSSGADLADRVEPSVNLRHVRVHRAGMVLAALQQLSKHSLASESHAPLTEQFSAFAHQSQNAIRLSELS